VTASLPLSPDLEERLGGTPLLVLLDLDGTLAPIAPRPDDVAVPDQTRRAVEQLTAKPGVHVAIVSGRGATDARRIVSLSDVWVIGNHGLEQIAPSGEIAVDPQVEPYGPALAAVARELAARLADIPGILVENKVWSLSVHYRLAEDAVVPRVKRIVEALVREHGLRLTEGKRVFEVRAPVRVDKGTAVLKLSLQLGALGDGASLLFAGDDITDEDAFRLLRMRASRAVTVRVNDDDRRPTAAEFSVGDTEGIRDLLVWLASIRR
jgi:trehalose-phosphatase